MQTGLQKVIFQTSDGCPIAYTLRASRNPDAPRLALIHSLAMDGSIWDGVAENLSDRAHVLTYDCRGHGRSGRKAISFTTELFARDLKELLDHVGWQSATIAGCSMGGCVAQEFAGRYPSRASALGLIDTTAWYGPDAPKNWRERAATARSKGLASMAEFQTTRWFGDQFRAVHPDLMKSAVDIFEANDVDCYAATCIMLGDADLRPYLPSLRIPVAVIVGEQDYATPPDMAEQLHKMIPGSTLTILPGARHLSPMECPDKIAALLLALLKQPQAKSG